MSRRQTSPRNGAIMQWPNFLLLLDFLLLLMMRMISLEKSVNIKGEMGRLFIFVWERERERSLINGGPVQELAMVKRVRDNGNGDRGLARLCWLLTRICQKLTCYSFLPCRLLASWLLDACNTVLGFGYRWRGDSQNDTKMSVVHLSDWGANWLYGQLLEHQERNKSGKRVNANWDNENERREVHSSLFFN